MLINIISSIVVFIVSMGINFFLAPYILKNLGNEAFGFVGLSNAIVAYAGVITTSINSVSGRFVAYEWHKGDIKSANVYYSSVLVVNIFFCALVALFSTIFILNLSSILNVPKNLESDVRLTFIFYFINFCVGLFNGVIAVCAFIKNKLFLISIRNAISSALLAILIITLFYLFHPMIAYIAICALICTIFVFFSTIFISARITPQLKFNFDKFNFKRVKELFYSGIYNSFTALNHVLLTGMDLFICNIFLGANITGQLATAKAAPIILESFCVQLSANFAPKFIKIYAANNISALIREVKFAMRVVAFIVSAPVAIFVIYAREFFTLWLSFKSADEINLIYNLSLISVIPVILISYVYVLFSLDSTTNKLSRPAIANTILGLSVVLAQILVLKFSDYGIYGAVIVSAALYSVRILTFDIINAALNLGARLSTFYGVYFKNLAIFVFLCAAFYGIKNFISIYNWLDFFLVCFAHLFIGYALSFFILFNKNEQAILKAKILAKFKGKF